MQSTADQLLSKGMKSSGSAKGLVVVQRISTGEITAIASQEGADNKKCFEGQAEAFRAWEPGSVIKTLTATAALNEHRLSLKDTFYNQAQLRIGDDLVVNALNIPRDDYSYQDMISQSINLGAIEALKRLSDHGQIDDQSRATWHGYLTEKYMFGQPTGVYEYEQPGYVPGLDNPLGTDARYARTSFGVGLTVTPIQLATAYAMVVNDGLYVPPTLTVRDSAPVVSRQVIAPEVSRTARNMLQTAAVMSNYAAVREGYVIGGKSGTAPSADETGTYQYYRSVGTYIGFAGSVGPEYVVLVKLDEPKDEHTFASRIAANLWAQLVNQLIDTGQIARPADTGPQ